jgi:hypothetical protein
VSAIRWTARIIGVLFVLLIVNGWQHDHYSFWFVVLVLVGASSAWVEGYTSGETDRGLNDEPDQREETSL